MGKNTCPILAIIWLMNYQKKAWADLIRSDLWKKENSGKC